MSKCDYCVSGITATRVSIMGMYDMHLFHKVEGATVDAVIDAWVKHIAEPIPATIGSRYVDDLGPSWLCPAIVLDDSGKEIRRVGKGVWPEEKRRKPRSGDDVEAYRQALLGDPDIPRLLMEQYGGKHSETSI